MKECHSPSPIVETQTHVKRRCIIDILKPKPLIEPSRILVLRIQSNPYTFHVLLFQIVHRATDKKLPPTLALVFRQYVDMEVRGRKRYTSRWCDRHFLELLHAPLVRLRTADLSQAPQGDI